MGLTTGFQGGKQIPTEPPLKGILASGVHVEQKDFIGSLQYLRECLFELLRPGISMGLKNNDLPMGPESLPPIGEKRPDLRGVVRIVLQNGNPGQIVQ
jgi:hypothetical protein